MSLRPFLPATTAWVPPGGVNLGPAVTHFGIRAAQRGVQSVPGDWLKWAVERAITQGRDDLVERMFEIDDGSTLYRVILPDGPTHPVIRNHVAVTVYSPKEVRALRQTRRWRKSMFGKRARPPGRR